MMSNEYQKSRDFESNRSISRRRLFAWSGTAPLAGVAGCSRTNNPSTVTESSMGSPTPPADSVFEDVGFAGPNLVVMLADGHDVDRLNLISPDGSIFEQTSVARGRSEERRVGKECRL